MTTPPPPVPPPYGEPPQHAALTGQPVVPPSGYPAYPAQSAYVVPSDDGRSSAPSRRPVQVWDVVLTIVFLIGLILVTAFASFAGLFLVMASDSCAVRDCSVDLITIGWLVGTILPWVVLIAALIVSIVFLVKRRLAFYIPLLGAVGVVGALVLGFVIAGAGVPSA